MSRSINGRATSLKIKYTLLVSYIIRENFSIHGNVSLAVKRRAGSGTGTGTVDGQKNPFPSQTSVNNAIIPSAIFGHFQQQSTRLARRLRPISLARHLSFVKKKKRQGSHFVFPFQCFACEANLIRVAIRPFHVQATPVSSKRVSSILYTAQVLKRCGKLLCATTSMFYGVRNNQSKLALFKRPVLTTVPLHTLLQ